MSTVLFGFDLAAIFAAILKLATEIFSLSAKTVRYVGALSVGAVVLVVGLQAQGIILGPETEQWAVLTLNVVTAVLTALGFWNEAIGTATAVVDLVRLKAVATYRNMVAVSDGFQDRVDQVLARYGFM